MAAIKIEDLKKYFGETKAVDGVSLEVNQGEIMGVLGPNGAGKTTTIRCLMDFLRPDAGSIEILGRDAQKNSTQLKKEIGFLSGEVRFYEGWTGAEHIELIERLRGVSLLDSHLGKRFNFDASKKVRNLSTGNKQKLGLILALMHQPQVLIMDEPTVGLDPLLQNSIYEILESEAARGTTIFMSSHNLREVERVCHRVAIIKQGQLVTVEPIDKAQIIESPLEKKFLEYYR